MIKIVEIRVLALLASVMAAGPVKAEYNDNLVGIITNILTYDSGQFLFTLSAMPAGACRNYFIVPADLPADARQMLLSRALTAKAGSEAVNIGFDKNTCINGWYRVHRIG